MTLSFSKVIIKDVGYAKRRKEIKDAYPKKVCHMLKRHVLKKRIGHMKVQVFKKRKKKRDSPCPKKNGERWFMKRSSYIIQQKYSHTCTS